MRETLYFSRRVIILCALLPAIGAAFVLPFGSVATIALSAALVAVLILLIWPAATIDVIGMALAAAIAIPFWLLLSQELWTVLQQNSSVATGWFWAIACFGTFFLWLGMVRIIASLDHVHAGTRHQNFSTFVDLSPKEMVKVMVLRANQEQFGRRAGPADENGFFSVIFKVDSVNLSDFSEETQEHSYFMRIVEEENLPNEGSRFVIQSSLDVSGKMRNSMEQMTFQPHGTGTHIRMNEVHDLFSVYAAMMFWLEDFQGADLYRRVEAHKSGVQGFSAFPSQKSLLTTIARIFIQIGLSKENER